MLLGYAPLVAAGTAAPVRVIWRHHAPGHLVVHAFPHEAVYGLRVRQAVNYHRGGLPTLRAAYSQAFSLISRSMRAERIIRSRSTSLLAASK